VNDHPLFDPPFSSTGCRRAVQTVDSSPQAFEERPDHRATTTGADRRLHRLSPRLIQEKCLALFPLLLLPSLTWPLDRSVHALCPRDAGDGPEHAQDGPLHPQAPQPVQEVSPPLLGLLTANRAPSVGQGPGPELKENIKKAVIQLWEAAQMVPPLLLPPSPSQAIIAELSKHFVEQVFLPALHSLPPHHSRGQAVEEMSDQTHKNRTESNLEETDTLALRSPLSLCSSQDLQKHLSEHESPQRRRRDRDNRQQLLGHPVLPRSRVTLSIRSALPRQD
jgi:hypothetical protein